MTLRPEDVCEDASEDAPAAERHAAPPDQWAGDMWRAAAAIRTARAERRTHDVDAEPTGLLPVAGLAPTSAMRRPPGRDGDPTAIRRRSPPLPAAAGRIARHPRPAP